MQSDFASKMDQLCSGGGAWNAVFPVGTTPDTMKFGSGSTASSDADRERAPAPAPPSAAPLAAFFFAGGAAFAYYLAMPWALHFLLGFEGNVGGVEQEIPISAGERLR